MADAQPAEQKQEKYAETQGKQPIDEMIDAPVREAKESVTISGARRTDH